MIEWDVNEKLSRALSQHHLAKLWRGTVRHVPSIALPEDQEHVMPVLSTKDCQEERVHGCPG